MKYLVDKIKGLLQTIFAFIVIIALLPFMLIKAFFKPSFRSLIKKYGLDFPPTQLDYKQCKELCDKGFKGTIVKILRDNLRMTLQQSIKIVDDFCAHESHSLLDLKLLNKLDIEQKPSPTLQQLIDAEKGSEALEWLRSEYQIDLLEAKSYLKQWAPEIFTSRSVL